MSSLTPERALIFRITHIDNVPWILSNGLHCRNSRSVDPHYREIGNRDLIDKRAHRVVPIAPGGTLSDYIPFYFTPYSPMLFNIKTGYNGMTKTPMSEIVILASSLHTLETQGIQFVFTDRHAYLKAADDTFSSDLADLGRIDWKILQARDFKRNPDDPGKFERYQAEALVHQHMPVSALTGLVCNGRVQEARLQQLAQSLRLNITIASKPNWYL
jgi:hypothetical protein